MVHTPNEESCSTSVEIDKDDTDGGTQMADIVKGGQAIEKLESTCAVDQQKAFAVVLMEEVIHEMDDCFGAGFLARAKVDGAN